MTHPARFFVTGIGTEIGKTFCTAVLAEAMEADYWKPIQSGLDTEMGDRDRVGQLVSNTRTRCWPEAYRLQLPASPHWAAEAEGIVIDPQQIVLPPSDNRLLVEGAGGLLVPVNRDVLLVDVMAQLGLPLIVVSKHYLGSINHTLLTIEAILRRGLPLAGVVFNGDALPPTETAISGCFPQVPILGRIPWQAQTDRAAVAACAQALRKDWEARAWTPEAAYTAALQK